MKLSVLEFLRCPACDGALDAVVTAHDGAGVATQTAKTDPEDRLRQCLPIPRIDARQPQRHRMSTGDRKEKA
jgi:hypothetical protein